MIIFDQRERKYFFILLHKTSLDILGKESYFIRLCIGRDSSICIGVI